MRPRLIVCTLVLALVVGLSHVPLATAGKDAAGSYAVYPRVVATVITLEPRGLALIRTPEGATYEVLKGTTWRVGDTVECDPVARTLVPWDKELVAASLMDYFTSGSGSEKFGNVLSSLSPTDAVPMPTFLDALKAMDWMVDDLDRSWREWVAKGSPAVTK